MAGVKHYTTQGFSYDSLSFDEWQRGELTRHGEGGRRDLRAVLHKFCLNPKGSKEEAPTVHDAVLSCFYHIGDDDPSPEGLNKLEIVQAGTPLQCPLFLAKKDKLKKLNLQHFARESIDLLFLILRDRHRDRDGGLNLGSAFLCENQSCNGSWRGSSWNFYEKRQNENIVKWYLGEKRKPGDVVVKRRRGAASQGFHEERVDKFEKELNDLLEVFNYIELQLDSNHPNLREFVSIVHFIRLLQKKNVTMEELKRLISIEPLFWEADTTARFITAVDSYLEKEKMEAEFDNFMLKNSNSHKVSVAGGWVQYVDGSLFRILNQKRKDAYRRRQPENSGPEPDYNNEKDRESYYVSVLRNVLEHIREVDKDGVLFNLLRKDLLSEGDVTSREVVARHFMQRRPGYLLLMWDFYKDSVQNYGSFFQ